MLIALIIIAIALQLWQWRYHKKCLNRYKLIAQEWREAAEATKDESTAQTTFYHQQNSNYSKQLDALTKQVQELKTQYSVRNH